MVLGAVWPIYWPDQVVAGHRDQVVAADIAQPVEDVGHPAGDRGLAGAGIAGEGHVQGRVHAGECQVPAQLVDQEQGRDLADAGLHRLEAHELAVELVQHLADAGLAVDGIEVDAGRCRSDGSVHLGLRKTEVPHQRHEVPIVV